jgi:sialidase-1
MRHLFCLCLLSPTLLLTLQSAARTQEAWDAAVICRGSDKDGSLSFPDICCMKNGDLSCVFYAGSGHGTPPTEKWPRCGRIMGIRSTDQGKTWSKPAVVVDTPDDDRDPSITCLKDGTLLLNWFAVAPAKAKSEGGSRGRLLLSRSTDSGKTWSKPKSIEVKAEQPFACSSPIRQLADGSLLLGLYCEGGKGTFGATIKSYDGGKTWKDFAPIGEKARLYLDAETDVVALKGGRLLAALRSSDTKGKGMYSSESSDGGKTWGPIKPLGFHAHCPYFLRHSSGVILLGVRLVRPTSKSGEQTALYGSADEAKTWKGPVQIDYPGGAYPSMVELPDHAVYCVFYDGGDEKGQGSSIFGKPLRVSREGVTVLPTAKR